MKSKETMMKNIMKRGTALCMAGVMAFSMTACSQKQKNSSQKQGASSQKQEATVKPSVTAGSKETGSIAASPSVPEQKSTESRSSGKDRTVSTNSSSLKSKTRTASTNSSSLKSNTNIDTDSAKSQ